MIGVFAVIGALGAIALLSAMAYAFISLTRLPPDSRGKSIFWLYGMEQDVHAEDLLVDEDARATWTSLTEEEHVALLAWVNKRPTTRSREARQRDAIRALRLGGAKTGFVQPAVLETILTSLPWGRT
jgi:hypothetical protein